MVASKFWGLQVHRAESVRFQEGVGENIWWSVSHSHPLRSWFPSGLDQWQGKYCTFSRPCLFHHQGVFKTPVLLPVPPALIFGKLCWVFRSQSHLLLLSVLWPKKICETYSTGNVRLPHQTDHRHCGLPLLTPTPGLYPGAEAQVFSALLNPNLASRFNPQPTPLVPGSHQVSSCPL